MRSAATNLALDRLPPSLVFGPDDCWHGTDQWNFNRLVVSSYNTLAVRRYLFVQHASDPLLLSTLNANQVSFAGLASGPAIIPPCQIPLSNVSTFGVSQGGASGLNVSQATNVVSTIVRAADEPLSTITLSGFGGSLGIAAVAPLLSCSFAMPGVLCTGVSNVADPTGFVATANTGDLLYQAHTSETLAQCLDILALFQAALTTDLYDGLCRGLDWLLGDEEELKAEGIVPQVLSFFGLASYLAKHPEFKCPSLGINRDGLFAAAWHPGGKARITLEFTDAKRVRWIFTDLRAHDPGEHRTSIGDELTSQIDQALAGQGAHGWMRA